MADNTGRGRFVWHELMTPDTSGAHAFYSKVLGWKSQSWEHDPSYQMFTAASGPLGGSVTLPSGPPHWLHYVGTPDIEATVQQVKSQGGSVTKEITSIESGGKYAVLADPQGAAFAVYSSQESGGKEAPVKRGEFSWHELATTDTAAALAFYSAVFGWEKMAEYDMGAEGKYVVFGSGGVQRGGMFKKPAQMPGAPSWLGYVRVKDVNDAVKKVKAARGSLVNGPMEVPGGDWIAQFVDPYGAMFAVHALAADAKAAQPAAGSSAAAPEATAAAKPAAPPKKKSAGGPATTIQNVPAQDAPAKQDAPVKKAPTKKASPQKAPVKKASAQKAAARKAPAQKKAGKKKAAGKKSAAKAKARPAKTARKGGRKAAGKSRPAARKKAVKKARKGK